MPPQAAGLAEARSPAPRKHMHPIAFPPHSKSPSAFHKAEGLSSIIIMVYSRMFRRCASGHLARL